jgi:hypothetical protein
MDALDKGTSFGSTRWHEVMSITRGTMNPQKRAKRVRRYTSVVRRLFLFMVLLVSLAFQGVGFAAQRDLGAGHDDHDQIHAGLHWQDVAHHHSDAGDDAGSVVVDNSAESVSHLASDGALSSPAMPAVPAVVAAVSPPGSPPEWLQPFPPSPDIQGLRRPPRQLL